MTMFKFLKKKLVEGEVNSLNERVGNAFYILDQDLKGMSNWINSLERAQQSLANSHHTHIDITKNDLEKLKKWTKDMDQYHSKLREYLIQVNSAVKEINEEQIKLKKEVEELKSLKTALMISNNPKEHSKQDLEIKKETPASLNNIARKEELSGSEQLILRALYSADKPLTYSQLAQETKLNYGTVKNAIYRLRKKNIEVHDQKTPQGEKEFFFTAKSKIELSGR